MQSYFSSNLACRDSADRIAGLVTPFVSRRTAPAKTNQAKSPSFTLCHRCPCEAPEQPLAYTQSPFTFKNGQLLGKIKVDLSEKLGERFRDGWLIWQLSIEPTPLDPEPRNRPGTDYFFILPKFQKQVILSAIESVG